VKGAVVARRNWFGPVLVLLLLLGDGPVAPAHSDDRKAAATQAQLDSETDVAILKREQEYRTFFEAMDKKHNKIARALKEYADPKTSDAKKIKLQTYLRQTSVDRPEERKLLKGALNDFRIQGEIISDIQMALMHAIQDHPEDSDKEYILELLEKKEGNIGWLYYTMLKIWDARYVPYLMDLAKNGRPSAIEILGRAKVKEAVPLLENLLNDHQSENVRAEAIMALRQITGNEYKWQESPRRNRDKKKDW
jgi:hypothetical protein